MCGLASRTARSSPPRSSCATRTWTWRSFVGLRSRQVRWLRSTWPMRHRRPRSRIWSSSGGSGASPVAGSSASVYGVVSIMERPRTFFLVLNGQAGTGMPAFRASGKVAGLLTIRQIDPGPHEYVWHDGRQRGRRRDRGGASGRRRPRDRRTGNGEEMKTAKNSR